jgi:arginase
MDDIKIVEVDSEIGAGTRGASLGIAALKVAALNAKSDFFKNYEAIKVENENKRLWNPSHLRNAKYLDGIAIMYKRISNSVSEVLKNGSFPLVLSGDHSNAGGTIAGIKMAFQDKRLGVIWVDAHGDLHTPYTSPSGNVHGMPLATALAEDNLESKCNEPAKETVELWEKVKNTGGISPKISPQDLVFFGVRDTEQPERDYIERKGIKNFTVAECREKGIRESAQEALNMLGDCDIIYVSFDVDSMDCEDISSGTGTPVPNGFNEKETLDLLQVLVSSPKLRCLECVEVNPTLDEKRNRMADTAFRILDSLAKTIRKS